MTLAPEVGIFQQVSNEEESQDLPWLLTLSPPLLLDPSLVAFLRAHNHTREQTETKATKEQNPERPSVPVSKEEPIMSTCTGESGTRDKLEDKLEDKLQPRTPGLENRHHHFVREEKIAQCGGACF